MTPGDWRYERDARGSRALFGLPGEQARAVIRCDRAPAAVTLSRVGAAGSLTVRATAATRTLAATAATDAPYTLAVLSPTDPLLDAIAFSRGRFVLQLPGERGDGAPLVLPPWAEIGRVIEDCRAP